VRGRVESTLGWAAMRNLRSADNPARWKGCLEFVLPYLTSRKTVRHFTALPHCELPAFMLALRAQAGIAARALEFVALTATRVGETTGLIWAEVDLGTRSLLIPGGKMKGGREHRSPLVGRALEILEELHGEGHRSDKLVFPGRGGRPLNDMTLRLVIHRLGYKGKTTTHGLRSTFSDWVTEETNFPKDAAELQLAHPIGGTVEMAYRRGNLLRKRYELMAAWDAFAYSAKADATVRIFA